MLEYESPKIGEWISTELLSSISGIIKAIIDT